MTVSDEELDRIIREYRPHSLVARIAQELRQLRAGIPTSPQTCTKILTQPLRQCREPAVVVTGASATCAKHSKGPPPEGG